ncbi:MAG: gyrase subunit [Actinomycetota bacterium]|nr:gyrase subunit [Actinomycetota bacterium]
MTDTTDVPPVDPGPHGRIEPVDLQVEMQRSYLDYAMSVIVQRALPDVRDGLKPVHRRVLYAMYDGGYRPDRGFSKCSRVVGDVMGQYHPHGDTAIYDTLVRLGQPWSLRYPLVQSQGNFGSPGDDRQAAMRYCVTGDTQVTLADGGTIRIDAIAPGLASNSECEIDLKVRGLDGRPVLATRAFHSGEQATRRLVTASRELTGSLNHPVLVQCVVDGDRVLRWKLVAEVSPGDVLAVDDVPAGTFSELPDGSGLSPIEGSTGCDATAYGQDTVLAVADAGVQPVYSIRVDTDDHAFVSNGFVSHNTECRLAPLAMEMVRDIDRDTVDFAPNYDGRQQEPTVLPARFPNLLVNGSGGIAVGMATNIPPHNLREVASGVMWHLDHPEANQAELLAALLERIKGPDFPTKGLIVGTHGIRDAYTTGRGSVTMRAVVEVEEDSRGRTILVISELPYQVNPDALARKIAELADSGKVQGIADLRDDSSSRTGMRLVVVLKRDAVASVVRNNLYKHTQLQDTFGCNMLALVDGVPRTLALDAFIRHWVTHQIEVIVRRTRYLLAEAERRAHILRGLLKALDRIDEVIALIRGSATAEAARDGLIELLEIDEIQAVEILNMQLRRLAALERQELLERYEQFMREIEEYTAILASDERQRQIVRDELTEVVERYGDERRTQLVPYEGDMSAEDFIPEEDVVVTITRGGYAKRTRSDLYRAQRRGGKGVRGAQLRQDDLVEHFFVTTTHHWILFFTNKGRVYRAKAYQLPDAGRDARGQHVANLLAFQPDEQIAQIIDLKDYEVAPYLVLATTRGMVKKTRLTEYDSNRTGGLIAINLREDDDGGSDEVISARLVTADDELLLVSRKAMSVRFTATDEALRPMGRATSGVTGMRFKGGDELLAMEVARPEGTVFTVTDGGFAKRTPVEEYRLQNRGGTGVQAMKFSEARGSLVGALVVADDDEVFSIKASGGVTRVSVGEVNPTGRVTMGVRFISLADDDTVVAIARNAERAAVEEELDEAPVEQSDGSPAGDIEAGSPAEPSDDEVTDQ